jgi:hypothetical protein
MPLIHPRKHSADATVTGTPAILGLFAASLLCPSEIPARRGQIGFVVIILAAGSIATRPGSVVDQFRARSGGRKVE